ncbi:hypothetical protein [Terrilactibacillus laevilacticus]|uniref:DUF2564 family protein n=1 Tax=Terrilactibacillus laevilacticus TaxID=1380157 RepID=A0ABW5PPN0_9BACI|nr:hypothetical protein [Terrilactibacillus laevilacticus]
MNEADQIQSKEHLKSLKKAQNYLQNAMNSITQAEAMQNNLAFHQTEQYTQKAKQELAQSKINQDPLIQTAEQDIDQADKVIKQIKSSQNNHLS